MANALTKTCHAELVSASSVPQARMGLAARWTLKQVQGYGVSVSE